MLFTTRMSAPFLVAGSILLLVQPIQAQPARSYNGITAGLEAHEQNEARRRAQISQQYGMVESARWYSPGPFWAGQFPAYGFDPLLGPSLYPLSPYYAAEPWYAPIRPGDRAYNFLRQPIGHRSGQTGPNRWEYHPIYPPGDTIGPEVVKDEPAPRVQPLLEEAMEEIPRPVRHGPREF